MPRVCTSGGLKRESIRTGRPNPGVGKWPPGANVGRLTFCGAPARTARSSDTRAAIKYLAASGAAAISIITDVDCAEIAIGTKPDAPRSIGCPADKARSVAAKARNIAGVNPDADQAICALQESAAHNRVALTVIKTQISPR
jgi:hypothetical protein